MWKGQRFFLFSLFLSTVHGWISSLPSSSSPFLSPNLHHSRRSKEAFLASSSSSSVASSQPQLLIQEQVGNGSYGTVHQVALPSSEKKNQQEIYIAKRALARTDLNEQQTNLTEAQLTDKANR